MTETNYTAKENVNNPDKYLTIRDAAKYLDIGVQRVYQLCKQGRIVATRSSKGLTIALEELEEFSKTEREPGWYSHKEYMPVSEQIKIKIRKWLNDPLPDWDQIKRLCDKAKGENE